MHMVVGIDDDERRLCFSEENLFGVGYGDDLAIDSDFKRPEWPFVEGGFETDELHRK